MAIQLFNFRLVLLLATFSFSVSGQIIASINCGATDVILDTKGVVWTPDTSFISNGVPRVVQPSNSISDIMDTLRVFTSRNKNCYSIPVTQGTKVLVRAIFNYGNYDGLSKPPSFDLQFDGNFWTTVQTSATGLTMDEVTYVTKGDDVSVCLAQTKSGQFPIISTIEVSGLDSEIYTELDDNRALLLVGRLSYGASETLRFPSDPYDRIWMGTTPDGTENVTSDAIFIDSTGPNNPPSGIFQNAITVASTTDSLFVASTTPKSLPFYLNMYFSEVKALDSTETRSFDVYETSSSGNTRLPGSISPPYDTINVTSVYNITVNSATNISLVATSASDYPPLINAIEGFYISDVLTDGTDSNDVAALSLLQSTFDVLGDWKGDPCLPATYTWDWLNCSNDATPRVTALYLDSFGLSGIFPDISSMDALNTIDLHNNTLIGTIPSSLGTLPNLQLLNLADNQFTGAIPSSLSKNNKLKLTATGNPGLCTSGKSCSSSPGTTNSSQGTISSSPDSTTLTKNKKKSKLPVVLGTTIPIFILTWIVAAIFIVLRKKGKSSNINLPNVTVGGANGHSGQGSNGNVDGLQKFGEEIINEVTNNITQQTYGSPSPLLNSSGLASDLYGQTGVQNP
ncbi:uncharacterized protein At1g24485-like [Rutidosis leptorrhynchoides]|uniref:uncharacterized protein At1g24485-like n=1 Tax=Rutidosis leptorrhynchoides TaxID=125765 RepID=UPI003A99756D